MPFDLDESFRPPRWLANPHLQSILPSLPLRRRALARLVRPVLAASRELLLECGDGVRLQAFHSSPAAEAPAAVASAGTIDAGGTPSAAGTTGATGTTGALETPGARVAVILHGWEGSSDSAYVVSLAQQLFARGFEVFRLNLRDHGATHHLNRELFHSCRLPEVIGAVRRIQELHPGKRLHLAGFSLGGNFMLRVAALADQAGLDIAKVVAVSPVLDPEATLEAMESGLAAYHRYFVRKWSRSLVTKETAWPDDYELSDVLRLANLRAMTAELVRRYTQFASLGDYLRGYAIVGARLATLRVPATLITALDDPIIPARDLDRLAPTASLELVVTRRGGHCGFLERFSGWTWAECRSAAELDAATRSRVRALPPAKHDASHRS